MKLRFVCSKCGKKQKISIWRVCILKNKKREGEDTIIYESEVRCKSCGSHQLEPDYRGIAAVTLRKTTHPEDDDEVIVALDVIKIENKRMPFSEAGPYIERRIREEPHNGELRLRHANQLRRVNRYDEAIEEYEESLRLNGNLIASLMNLCDIYLHRGKEYKEKEAFTKARTYLERAVNLYRSGKAVFTTIEDKKTIPLWIEDREEVLHVKKKH